MQKITAHIKNSFKRYGSSALAESDKQAIKDDIVRDTTSLPPLIIVTKAIFLRKFKRAIHMKSHRAYRVASGQGSKWVAPIPGRFDVKWKDVIKVQVNARRITANLGSIPPYHKPKDPNIKTGVTRIPGSPLGPAKKSRPCLKKRDVCWDRASKPIEETKPPKTPPKTPGKTPSKTPTKSRPVYKPSRFKVPKSAGNAAVFMLVAPYVHDALDAIKRWDNPIGRAVSWFDNAMASLQESIGGPQRTDIYGNELKYKMTKAIGSALQLGFETTWDKHELLAMNVCRIGDENANYRTCSAIETSFPSLAPSVPMGAAPRYPYSYLRAVYNLIAGYMPLRCRGSCFYKAIGAV
ncbi:hypothetical protein ARSEF1564_009312 [Beauveria bassiana]